MNALTIFNPVATEPSVGQLSPLSAALGAGANGQGGLFSSLLGNMLTDVSAEELLAGLEGAIPGAGLQVALPEGVSLQDLMKQLASSLGVEEAALPDMRAVQLAQTPAEQLQQLTSLIQQVMGGTVEQAQGLIAEAVDNLTPTEDLANDRQTVDEDAEEIGAMALFAGQTALVQIRPAMSPSDQPDSAVGVASTSTSAKSATLLTASHPNHEWGSVSLAERDADATPSTALQSSGPKAFMAASASANFSANAGLTVQAESMFVDMPEPDIRAAQGLFSQALSTSTAAPQSPTSSAWTVPGHMLNQNAAWSAAMSDRLSWMAGNGLQSATLMITPDDLGPIHVKIDMANNVAQVAFSADHADTQAMLDKLSPRLAAAFDAQGMRLEDVRVFAGASEAAARDFAQQQQQQQQAAQHGQSQRHDETSGQQFAQVLANGELSAESVASSLSRATVSASHDGALDLYA